MHPPMAVIRNSGVQEMTHCDSGKKKKEKKKDSF